MKTPKKEPEIIRIHKGRPVGKSTEVGAYEIQVRGRTIASVSHFEECEPVKGPVHELRDEPLTFSLGDLLKKVEKR